MLVFSCSLGKYIIEYRLSIQLHPQLDLQNLPAAFLLFGMVPNWLFRFSERGGVLMTLN